MRVLQVDGPRRLSVGARERPVAGPGEVLVRVRAGGVCGTDLHVYEGLWGSFPAIPGHDEITGVHPSVIRKVARDFAAAKPAMIYSGYAACKWLHGDILHFLRADAAELHAVFRRNADRYHDAYRKRHGRAFTGTGVPNVTLADVGDCSTAAAVRG